MCCLRRESRVSLLRYEKREGHEITALRLSLYYLVAKYHDECSVLFWQLPETILLSSPAKIELCPGRAASSSGISYHLSLHGHYSGALGIT